MSHWHLIRSRARSARTQALAEAQGNERAEALLAAADRLTGIKRVGLPRGDALLDGAQSALDLDIKYIWFDNTVESTLALFYQAHEYAHFWLHAERSVCDDADINPNAEDDDIPLGVDRVEGYGPRERHEREANVFAREFLLPLAVAREWYLNEALRTPAIVSRTGLPESVVLHQLARGVLVPGRSETDTEPPAAEEAALDESQRAAAQATRGPMLVDAGPGTGKTRTLCGRITHLLAQGVRPSAILALTFSNKAAEEMRERVAKSRPDVAPAIWMGTFHAYGLELLRKYGDRIGISASPEVLDPADAVAVLESRLTDLNLVHYQYLPEPARDLRHIVAAISRAKDDLVDPIQYAAFAERMRSTAASDEDHEAAAKAMEVANVYRVYQDTLIAENLLDFGDLIFRTVHLLREHPEVRDEVRRQHAHVLVDEYQDVNRASALFLKELVGGGAGLWVVGDARQSIYRFRGASPENIREFRRDFPGAKTLPLERNYRSASRILGSCPHSDRKCWIPQAVMDSLDGSPIARSAAKSRWK
jgi:DNA helicase II / ATP-dependent DNA helicase PcrA